MSLLLGPACSGSHQHAHHAAYNILFFGLKRWFAWDNFEQFPDVPKKLPKPIADLSSLHIVDWVRETRPQMLRADGSPSFGLTECYQHPADFVYMPGSWVHGVINVFDSVGMTAQRDPEEKVVARMRHLMERREDFSSGDAKAGAGKREERGHGGGRGERSKKRRAGGSDTAQQQDHGPARDRSTSTQSEGGKGVRDRGKARRHHKARKKRRRSKRAAGGTEPQEH